MVRALASHQCVLGSIPGPGVICGLSLLLVLYSALRGFYPGTPVFLPPQNQHFQIPVGSWNAQTFLNEFLWTPWCSVGKQIIPVYFFICMHTRLDVHVNLDIHTKLDSMQNLSALLTPSLMSTYNSKSSQGMTSIEKLTFIICCKNFSSFHEKNIHFL